jgi:hypothetical protein
MFKRRAFDASHGDGESSSDSDSDHSQPPGARRAACCSTAQALPESCASSVACGTRWPPHTCAAALLSSRSPPFSGAARRHLRKRGEREPKRTGQRTGQGAALEVCHLPQGASSGSLTAPFSRSRSCATSGPNTIRAVAGDAPAVKGTHGRRPTLDFADASVCSVTRALSSASSPGCPTPCTPPRENSLPDILIRMRRYVSHSRAVRAACSVA